MTKKAKKKGGRRRAPAAKGAGEKPDLQDIQRRVSDLLARARSGELAWMDEAVRAAGYGDPPGERVVITSRQLEHGLELSRRQVQEYITEGMPRLSDAHGNRPATFDLWPAMRWIRDFFKRAGGLPTDEALRHERLKKEYELRRQRADAELKEQQAWLETGRLVDRDKTETDVRHLLQRLQVSLENLPALISAESVGRSADDIAACARQAISDAWNNALDDLRRALPPKLQAPVAPIDEQPGAEVPGDEELSEDEEEDET